MTGGMDPGDLGGLVAATHLGQRGPGPVPGTVPGVLGTPTSDNRSPSVAAKESKSSGGSELSGIEALSHITEQMELGMGSWKGKILDISYSLVTCYRNEGGSSSSVPLGCVRSGCGLHLFCAMHRY